MKIKSASQQIVKTAGAETFYSVQFDGCLQKLLPVAFLVTEELEKSMTKAASSFDRQTVERMHAVLYNVQNFYY